MLKIFTILFFSFEFVFSQTVNIRTIGPSGCDYKTMQAWETGRGGNLVSENRVEIGKVVKGVYRDELTISGNTMDATRYMHIMADDTSWHDGTPGNGVIIAPTKSKTHGIQITDNWARVSGIQVSRNNKIIYYLIEIGAKAWVDRCIVYNYATRSMEGFAVTGENSNGATITNSIAINGGRTGFMTYVANTSPKNDTLYVYNCTSYNTATLDNTFGGFNTRHGMMTAKACISYSYNIADPGNDFKVQYSNLGGFANCDYNYDSDGTAPGTNTRTVRHTVFKDKSNYNVSYNIFPPVRTKFYGKTAWFGSYDWDITGKTRTNWGAGAFDGDDPPFERRYDILFVAEERDWYNYGTCGTQSAGWSHFFTYPDFYGYYYNGTDSTYYHADNLCNNDSKQSIIIGNKQFQTNCAYRSANQINLFVRKFSTQELIDSLVIYSDPIECDNERLTLQGTSRIPHTDTLLIGGFERQGYGGGDENENHGIYKYVYPNTTAELALRTRNIDGLGIKDTLVYAASTESDTIKIFDWRTWDLIDIMIVDGSQNTGGTIIGQDTIYAVINRDTELTEFWGIKGKQKLWQMDPRTTHWHQGPANPNYGAWFTFFRTKGRIIPIITNK